MSFRRQQQETFRCIAFRLGRQTFAVDAASVVSAHEAGYVGPVQPDCLPGATGTLRYGEESLSVFNVARWLGIEEQRDDREHCIIVQAHGQRIVLQVRDVSRVLTMAPEKRVPLPPPLDQLVGDRYSAIVKWTSEARQLTADDVALGVKGQEQQQDMFLQIQPNVFLQEKSAQVVKPILATGVGEQKVQVGKPRASTASSRHRLLMFAPSLEPLGDRECLFGISAAQVLEVCRPLRVVPVPGAGEQVLGVVDWRDSVVPVLKMAELVGMESLSDDGAQRLLIAKSPQGNHLIGVHVTSAIRTQAMPLPYVAKQFPVKSGSRYFYGAYELERETLLMPNLLSMLGQA